MGQWKETAQIQIMEEGGGAPWLWLSKMAGYDEQRFVFLYFLVQQQEIMGSDRTVLLPSYSSYVEKEMKIPVRREEGRRREEEKRNQR